MRNSQQSKQGAWLTPLSVLALVVGALGATAWITERTNSSRIDSLPADVQRRLATGGGQVALSEKITELQEEVTKLREDNTTLENAIAEGNKGSMELNDRLQEMKMFAGLTEIEGPGLVVTLRDSELPSEQLLDLSSSIIHDTDVLLVVNELWNAGAEGLAVNGIRVGPRTCIRCVGSTILVDDTRTATPVHIQAVGDQDTLFGALNMPGGPIDNLRRLDPKMVTIDISESQVLPAFAGTTTFKHAKTLEAHE